MFASTTKTLLKRMNTKYNPNLATIINIILNWNPGEIPNEVKDILFKSHPSMPRNLKISQTFFRAGFVEYWGSGIKRITDACKEYGSPIPEIVNEAGGVAVKCKASDSYLKAMKGENSLTAQTSPKRLMKVSKQE